MYTKYDVFFYEHPFVQKWIKCELPVTVLIADL